MVSAAAKDRPNEINKFSESYELNTNWLSICIYDQFCSDPDENDKTFTNMMDHFKDRQDPEVLSDEESVYSAMFFRALDRFLLPNDDMGCVLHQPSLGTKDRPDGYIATLKGNLLSVPILTSDFKKEKKDFQRATTESIGYFLFIMISGKKVFQYLLCLAQERHYHCICAGPLMIIIIPPSNFARLKMKSFRTFFVHYGLLLSIS